MESFDITEHYVGGYAHEAADAIGKKMELHSWVYLTALLVIVILVLLFVTMRQGFVQEKYTDTNTVGSAYAKPPPLPMTFSGSRVAMQNSYPESGLSTGDGPANARGVCQPGGANDDAYAWMLAHYNDPDTGVTQRFVPYLDPETGSVVQGFSAAPSTTNTTWGSDAMIYAMRGGVATPMN